MARVPIALELYSVREDLAKDVAGTLAAVAKMGYDGVEFAGGAPAAGAELKQMLDDNGLVCCSWHTGFGAVQDETLAATIELNQAVGNQSIIVPGLPGHLVSSRDGWLKMADFFNALTAKLAPYGMYTGYHNHHTEFTLLDGEWPWDTFFGHTCQEVVMQLDTGNALRGGGESVPILQRYPGRARSVHLKPFKVGCDPIDAGFDALIGDDSVPWDQVFELSETIGGTEWYIVEYESAAYPSLEAVERCLTNLKAMGK